MILFSFDRGYISYLFLASLLYESADFLGRCSQSSFKEARKMFHQNISSTLVTLHCSADKRKEAQALGLPFEIIVRFVRVIRDNGDVEVLVTSLLDEEKYPSDEFKELHYKRWGIETFYG